MYDLDQIRIKRPEGVYLYLPKMKNISKSDYPKYAYHEKLRLASNSIRNLLKSIDKIKEQIAYEMNKGNRPSPKVLTTTEWKEKGGYELKPGEIVKVMSESNGIIYTIKRTVDGSNIYCSCPAWKYQNYNPLIRTCKHIKAVSGYKLDKERIKANMGRL